MIKLTLLLFPFLYILLFLPGCEKIRTLSNSALYGISIKCAENAAPAKSI